MQKTNFAGVSFFLFSLKARLQVIKFEFCQINWSGTTDKLASNWQNFAQVKLQLKFAFHIEVKFMCQKLCFKT